MCQDQIAVSADLLLRGFIIAADRCAACVSAGHHKTFCHFNAVRKIKQQHVQRCIRQHDADGCVIGSDHIIKINTRFLFQQQDRLLPAGQHLLLSGLHQAVIPDCFYVSHHDRKWLHRAMFSFTQQTDSIRIFCVAAEVKPADPFDRDDLSLHDRLTGGCNRVCSAQTGSENANFRTAVIAADGLCVISACLRVFVFSLTRAAHRESCHGRPRSVIRHGIQNGQPRAALRTVDERMQIAAVIGVKQFCFALVAGRNIRGNKNIAVFLLAFDDLKSGEFPVLPRL